ncbi:uncharacterized protein LOC111340091 [Stylophora pistillata]|uniref:uncharacterized protein LOC111340091 n=1 Tax=Stylophora pistillata TaxID=50429 RepID=UPI000C03E594|nr:uncharacterized protein LOC111340091 [Stylophora pistillata]
MVRDITFASTERARNSKTSQKGCKKTISVTRTKKLWLYQEINAKRKEKEIKCDREKCKNISFKGRSQGERSVAERRLKTGKSKQIYTMGMANREPFKKKICPMVKRRRSLKGRKSHDITAAVRLTAVITGGPSVVVTVPS